jgi:hypothetical protein
VRGIDLAKDARMATLLHRVLGFWVLSAAALGGCSDDGSSSSGGGGGSGAGSGPGGGPPGGDETAPVVMFVAPDARATLEGDATLAVTASDDVGVASVEFHLDAADGTLLGAGTAAADGYELGWNSAQAANGAHTLYAVATDAAGNRGEATLAVTVANELPSTGGLTAVATFEALGLYLPLSASTGEIDGAEVQFRALGEARWRDALPLWLDERDDELRGSILHLTAGLAYEVQVSAPGGDVVATGTFGTWSEIFPVDEDNIVTISGTSSEPIVITESGTPTAYRLYQGGPSGGTIDMGFEPEDDPDHCVTVDASYVIIRGLTLKNCQANGVEIEPGAHDVIIEGNDISSFGAGYGEAIEGDTATIFVGYNETAAVACTGYGLPDDQKQTRIVVQGNRIRNPRHGSNPWSYGHPAGTNGIGFFECGGNHVIRYNDVLGSHGHYLMDGIGGSDNFTSTGFPNNDSDIYGNYVSHAYDDGIEAEGGNRQVRIWGNYITNTFIGIANGTVSRGPMYVVRNITSNHAGMFDPEIDDPDEEDERGLFFKLGSQDDELVGGKAYYLHNTSLQPACPQGVGATLTCGIDSGMQNSAGSVQATNIECANNIFTNFDSGNLAIGWQMDDGSGTFEHDLYIGGLDVTEVGGIEDYPVFASDVDEGLELNTHSGAGDTTATRSYDPTRTPNEIADFSLAAGSPGRGQAKALPNINDQYAEPDVGAHQSGTGDLAFGTAAWTGVTAW